MEHIKLYIGYDEREAVGAHVFLESLWKHCSLPVSVTVLTPQLIENLGTVTDGSNAFSTARFAIPHLMGYSGWAIFLDGADQLMRADLAELWRLQDFRTQIAVKVVQHDYRTKSPRKYLGTDLEADNQDYERKNWSSVILWNCGHKAHFQNRDKLLSGDGKYLHRFSWLHPSYIGDLPPSWNHLVGEQEFNPDAKLAHFTLGIPGFEHYKQADYAGEWTDALKAGAQGLQAGKA